MTVFLFNNKIARFSARSVLIVLIIVLAGGCAVAQQTTTNNTPEETAYRTMIDGRAYKIVAPLSIKDSTRFYKVRDLVANQYHDLKRIQDGRDDEIKSIQEKSTDKTQAAKEIKAVEAVADAKLTALHKNYLQNLGQYLDAKQTDAIKDGMTYNVVPITYKGYLEMIPRLTTEEKKFIMDALVEAREHAIDAGTSEKKHAWFGKYKGRINNYLSSHGYDMNKESKAWQERMKKEKNQSN